MRSQSHNRALSAAWSPEARSPQDQRLVRGCRAERAPSGGPRPRPDSRGLSQPRLARAGLCAHSPTRAHCHARTGTQADTRTHGGWPAAAGPFVRGWDRPGRAPPGRLRSPGGQDSLSVFVFY